MTSPPSPADDVRMRGFRQRARVGQALEWVDAQTAPLACETIAVNAAAVGRILGEDVVSPIDVPPFDRSAMDGYAVAGAATDGAGPYNPLPFRVVGEALPGRPFAEVVKPGEAVRIMTGAPVPPGTDAVVPAEYAVERTGIVEVLAPVSPGKNVGPRGEDVAAQAIVAHRGRRLRPQDVALAASVGATGLAVIGRPRVRILVTGNELARAGTPRGDSQIYDSNTLLLEALAARDGGVVEAHRLLPDDRDRIRTELLAPGADVILVSGGSSVGAEDHAPGLVAECGTLDIHGIAMRPSSPAGMGRFDRTLVFLLPGNPVSCLCAYDFFAGRAIRRLAGRPKDWPYPLREMEVGRKIVSAVGRVDYTRVRIHEGRVEPVATSGASILSSTTRADGFVIVPEECEGYPPGARVRVYLYDSP